MGLIILQLVVEDVFSVSILIIHQVGQDCYTLLIKGMNRKKKGIRH